MKARIIVYGFVQGVGYRAFVKKIADSLGLSGSVENLEDGSVEIYINGSKSAISLFLDKINIKLPAGPDVFKIDCYYEGEAGYIPKDLTSFFVIL
ncbi:MAG: acylphosphatase [Candidatus Micrarchaeaceae archaeon]